MSQSINRTVKTCSWVLGELPNTHRCGKPVRWNVVEDEESGELVRSYKNYCPKHEAEKAAMPICLKCGDFIYKSQEWEPMPGWTGKAHITCPE